MQMALLMAVQGSCLRVFRSLRSPADCLPAFIISTLNSAFSKIGLRNLLVAQLQNGHHL
jgi:hypothetical protein